MDKIKCDILLIRMIKGYNLVFHHPQTVETLSFGDGKIFLHLKSLGIIASGHSLNEAHQVLCDSIAEDYHYFVVNPPPKLSSKETEYARQLKMLVGKFY